MKAFFVKHPDQVQPSVVIAHSAGMARYRLYLHCKELGPHMLRSTCGLRTYNVTHFTARRAPAFDQLAGQGAKCWDKHYATAALQ